MLHGVSGIFTGPLPMDTSCLSRTTRGMNGWAMNENLLETWACLILRDGGACLGSWRKEMPYELWVRECCVGAGGAFPDRGV